MIDDNAHHVQLTDALYTQANGNSRAFKRAITLMLEIRTLDQQLASSRLDAIKNGRLQERRDIALKSLEKIRDNVLFVNRGDKHDDAQ